ncbi:sodium/potassium-transporting ATPase subunit beta-1-interacting protein 1 [Elysia marginata]|uniref:Sodium/potassium-transporting ATPase subunit beta-1-interacting protein n=1 Tax=Elysia marginata TaxID=1093978 RepID=A0AAV4ESF5_9GAST|nr:sodium/potassium-transporting ATPase subunit beta-1-interacting protein 1 [Elysia marginata]
MEADDKWFTKALRTTLIVLFTLQLVSTLERQVFDFLGYMWAPIIGNFFQIIVVILGIFGACNFYRSFIVVSAEEGGRRIPPEDSVVGCILQYYYVEVIHAGVQCLLSLGGFVASCICIYSFIEGDDPSKYPQCSGTSPTDLCRSGRMTDSPLLPFSAELMSGCALNFTSGRAEREAGNEDRKGNWLSFSLLSRLSENTACSRQANRRRRKKKGRNQLDSSLVHSPYLSRLHSPLPSLPHIAFPLSSIPPSRQCNPPDSDTSQSPSSLRKACGLSFSSNHMHRTNIGSTRRNHLDSHPTGDHSLITLTPPSRRYLGPSQQIQNLMNAFSSSSSSPSPAITRPQLSPTLTHNNPLPQPPRTHRHQYVSASSNHKACSSFFSFQVNASQLDNQNDPFLFKDIQTSFLHRGQSQENFECRGRAGHSSGYKFEDQPTWWQDGADRDWVDSGHGSRRKFPNFRHFNRGDMTRSQLNPLSPRHHQSKGSRVSRVDSWLSEDEGEDDVFFSSQEMEGLKLNETAGKNFRIGGSDTDEDVWVLQTEL